MSPLYAASLALLVLCVGLAIWRGGGSERLTAAILVLVWIGTAATPFDGVYPPWPIIAMDGFVALLLLYLAMFSRRIWPIWAAAFQTLLMANHLAFIRFHEIQHWAYVVGYYVWGDAVMLALILGALTRKRTTPPSAGASGQDPGTPGP